MVKDSQEDKSHQGGLHTMEVAQGSLPVHVVLLGILAVLCQPSDPTEGSGRHPKLIPN